MESLRRRRDPGEGPGDLEHRGDPRGVVGGPVEDLVPLALGVASQVVPVGGVDQQLVLEPGVGALEPGEDVLRLHLAQGIGDLDPGRAAERHGPEVARRGGLLERVEVAAARPEQLPGLGVGDPSLDRDAVGGLPRGLGPGDVEVLAAPAPPDDLERIAGRPGLVDQDRRGRALLRGDLVLVGPSAVVRHRPALEHRRVELRGILRVGDGRVVHQHQERLAPHVEALVIVPAVFRRHHAVADEDDLRAVDLDVLRHPPRDGHEVGGERQGERAAMGRDGPADPRRPEPHQRHVLHVGAIRVARLQPHLAELVRQVGDRLLLARRARPPALELVRGEDLDVGQDLLRLDPVQRLVQRRVGAGARHHGGQQQGRQGEHSAGVTSHRHLGLHDRCQAGEAARDRLGGPIISHGPSDRDGAAGEVERLECDESMTSLDLTSSANTLRRTLGFHGWKPSIIPC